MLHAHAHTHAHAHAGDTELNVDRVRHAPPLSLGPMQPMLLHHPDAELVPPHNNHDTHNACAQADQATAPAPMGNRGVAAVPMQILPQMPTMDTPLLPQMPTMALHPPHVLPVHPNVEPLATPERNRGMAAPKQRVVQRKATSQSTSPQQPLPASPSAQTPTPLAALEGPDGSDTAVEQPPTSLAAREGPDGSDPTVEQPPPPLAAVEGPDVIHTTVEQPPPSLAALDGPDGSDTTVEQPFNPPTTVPPVLVHAFPSQSQSKVWVTGQSQSKRTPLPPHHAGQ